MRVWVDITNSPHVLFFRPLIRLLQADGHDVSITAREYAQTLELLELHGLAHEVVGPRHGGAGVLGKARALVGRLPALRRFAKTRSFDLALAHGSHELTLAARSLGIPSATAHDYEYATLQHQLGLRRGDASRLPGRDPRRPARTAGCEAAEAPPVSGDRGGVLPRGLRAGSRGARRHRSRPRCSRSCERRRTSRSTTGMETRSSRACSSGSAATSPCTPSCCLARASSAKRFVRIGLPSLHIPEHAVDAPSLVALADLTVSAGGTMNREAAALGTPAYTTFTGRVGAVDERLMEQGRLRPRRRARRSQARSRCRARPARSEAAARPPRRSRFRCVRRQDPGQPSPSRDNSETFLRRRGRHEGFT